MIRFKLIGMPIHIHPTFWAATLAWGVGVTLGEPHPVCVLYFALALFICLLVHECGHALAGRLLAQGEVGVFLSWLGGTCCCEKEPQCSLRQGIMITLAGPLSGLLIAGAIYGWLAVEQQSAASAAELAGQLMQGQVPAELIDRGPGLMWMFAAYLLQISVVWGALNLLPIYPLDGGLMMHELMGNTHLAHSISMGATCLLALVFMAFGIWALAGFMLVLSYYNYRCILVHLE